MLDGDGKPLVDVIVGHRRVRTQGNVPEQVYVRRPGDNQAWLAEGGLQADSDPQLWLDRDILNIEHGDIARVESVRGGQTLVFTKQGDKLLLTEPAEHPKLDDYKQEDVARALELLTFQDVRPIEAGAAAAAEPSGRSVFRTTSGLAIAVTVYHGEKDLWARFAISVDNSAKANSAKAEADRLSARLSGWEFQVGSWKEKALTPTMDDLKAAEKPADTAAPADLPPSGLVSPGTVPGTEPAK